MTTLGARARGRLDRHRVASLAIGLMVTLCALPAAATGAQGLACLPSPEANRIEMGAPDPEGVNRSIGLRSTDDSVGFHFTVPADSAVLLYVGDQWFDLDLYLYARGRCPAGSWEQLIRAWSTRTDRRLIQFMRPDEQIANLLRGEYLMVALYKMPEGRAAADAFDPTRQFTARVALLDPYCGLDPVDIPQIPHIGPAIPLPKRPDEALYQLGLSISPPEAERVPFSLMSFNAFVSPPYTDLFDFVWVLDGQRLEEPDVCRTCTTYQIPTTDLRPTPGGQHRIEVTATGAREYPDPTLTHTPPTLKVGCAFRTSVG